MTQSNPKNTLSHQAQYSKRSICSQNQSPAEGAFLFAPIRPAGGIVPLRALSRSGPKAIRAASACGPWLRPGGVAQRRAGGRSPRCRVWHREACRAASAQCIGVGSTGIVAQARCRSQAKCEGFRVYHLCGWGVFEAVVSAWRLPWYLASSCGLSSASASTDSLLGLCGFRFQLLFAPCSCAVCAPCNQPWSCRGFSCIWYHRDNYCSEF